ncbi:MAG: P-II family nitrogen regulator [Nitrospirae bacterium]|nr:P-II family nitrogen regulator [Nitrospirota bacterium]
MKMICAIVRWTHLKEVEQALFKIGERSFSVTKIKGLGEEKGYLEYDLVSHLKIEIITSEGRVKKIKDAIVKAAWTGVPGDGVIAVLPVEELTKIREAERPNRFPKR